LRFDDPVEVGAAYPIERSCPQLQVIIFDLRVDRIPELLLQGFRRSKPSFKPGKPSDRSNASANQTPICRSLVFVAIVVLASSLNFSPTGGPPAAVTVGSGDLLFLLLQQSSLRIDLS